MKKIDSTRPNHILIGLGGTGGKVLKNFRKRLWEEFPRAEDRNKLSIGFVYVDSTDEMMKPGDPTWKVFGESAQFEKSEFVNIKSVDLGQILAAPDAFPGLSHVVKNGEMMKKTLGEVGAAAGQKRRAGRILFASHISQYMGTVKSQWEKVSSISGDKGSCHIHIFTGLAGGTGSGSIIDAVTQLRADATFGSDTTNITVYAMVPELDPPSGCDAGRYHQNGYAALCELSALNVSAFMPCDVFRGDEHTKLNTQPLKQFGLMVYSNVNENGTVVKSFSELPKLLADTVYFSIFMQIKAGVNDDFIRGLSCENFTDYLVEYNFNSKGDDRERARTKAVSSFGIKRIVYPEQRVVEHISYTLAKSIFRQMRFNNYRDDVGFTDEPQRKDYEQLYLKNDSLMNQWKLTDDFLMLNKRILDDDRPFKPFEDYWKEQAEFYSYDDAKKAESNPLHYVAQFCQDLYNKNFRLKQSVEEYYKDKSKDDVMAMQVLHIVESIEQNLYTQWYQGSLSLEDLLQVCDKILQYVKDRRQKMVGEITESDEVIAGFQKELDDNMSDYTNMGVAQKLMNRAKDRYTDHQEILADLYVEKSRRVAREFAVKLMAKLQVAFEDFYSEVQSFVGALAVCMDEAQERISDRNQSQGNLHDMNQAVIEVIEYAKVWVFEESLLRNRGRMEKLASTLRHALVGNKTFAHFNELAKSLSVDHAFDVVDGVMGQLVREIHDTECSKDKLMGINVLQQLQKVLVTDDDIRAFAEEAVKKSGVFVLLDHTSLIQAYPNNPNPVSNPASMDHKAILVTMPPSEGDDSLKLFADKLQNALRNAFGTPKEGYTIQFDTIGEVKNEITIAAVRCCFPLRALKWMPVFEGKYRAMTDGDNPSARENRILLHSEGDGSQIPAIMGEKQMTAQEFMPYYFLAAAIGIIKVADDAINGRGWCISRKGEWGIEQTHFLSAKFTDLPTSEHMTKEMRDEIEEKVSEVLKDAELTMAKRGEMAEQVKMVMRDHVAAECSSPTSPKFQQFGNEAKKALDIINKR
ncbi:MAG: hypothetical protein IJ764_01630 [Bacteroidales bacterium]|nr:hypothetical protein [Bacteroidales bacterium]